MVLRVVYHVSLPMILHIFRVSWRVDSGNAFIPGRKTAGVFLGWHVIKNPAIAEFFFIVILIKTPARIDHLPL